MRIRHPLTISAVLTSMLLLNLSSAKAQEAEAVPGEYLVKLKAPLFGQDLKKIEKELGAPIESTIPEHRIVRIQKATVQTSKSVIKSLSQNPNVELVEPNYIYRAIKTPNDPELQRLWGLKNFGQSDTKANGTSGIDIDAERAWDLSTGSEDVLVAVIDTGVDSHHPDLKDNVWVNEAEANGKPEVDDDNNGYVDDIHGYNFVDAEKPTPESDDDHGHGSHCAGTIGGRGDDGKGIVGVNWKVKILSAKFLGADGGGSLEGAILAIDYATKAGAKILSNSWGGGGESELLKEAIQRAHSEGALFVAAAGNDGTNNDISPHFPSNYNVPNVLSVAAIDNNGQLASFSNYGKQSVHIAAPGVNIYSSIGNNSYAIWSGTSMATPHVSGVAALLAAKDPSLSHLQIRQRLMASRRPLASLRSKVSSGGMVNAYFALTGQEAPPDMNDPIHWQSQPLAISSAHPYKGGTEETYEVEIPGAKEIALYFSRFETERGYDKVSLFNRAGEKVTDLSGSMDDAYGPVITGDYVRVVFTSDDSVEKYGFDLTKVSYR
ncbi:MAG: S8 family serine peptidase [Pseudobdellovibrionaceae bacterium]